MAACGCAVPCPDWVAGHSTSKAVHQLRLTLSSSQAQQQRHFMPAHVTSAAAHAARTEVVHVIKLAGAGAEHGLAGVPVRTNTARRDVSGNG